MYTQKTLLHTPIYAPVEKTPSFQSSALVLSDFQNYWLRDGVLEDTLDLLWTLRELYLNSK